MLLIMMEGLSKSKCDNPSSSAVRQLYVLRTGCFSAPYPADRVQMTSALSSSLHEALLTMAMYTSSERGRAAVPLITSNATISPFPMSIVVKVGGVEVP
jgi:hypothetical protein